MTIKVKIIADSISKADKRITTFQLKYARFFHSELMTHRVFSRNASSSRAVPVTTTISNLINDPVYPKEWGKNQKGMVAEELLNTEECDKAIRIWDTAKHEAIESARKLIELGVHKQIANRLLEPFSQISVVLTSTEWENFFELRCHKDALPDFQELACEIRKQLSVNTPKLLSKEEWHIPYIKEDEYSQTNINTLLKISAARCARVSYLNHDGSNPDLHKDLELYYRLVGSKPLHASPIEHQATPYVNSERRSNNFKGWLQLREFIEKGYLND